MYLTVCFHVSIIARGSVFARKSSSWDSHEERSRPYVFRFSRLLFRGFMFVIVIVVVTVVVLVIVVMVVVADDVVGH